MQMCRTTFKIKLQKKSSLLQFDLGQSIKLQQYFGITSLGSGTIVAKRLCVYRAIVVRLLVATLRLIVPLKSRKFSGDNGRVVAR